MKTGHTNRKDLYTLQGSSPLLALESTVITHGLPRPQNLELARAMEAEVRRGGATPATIAVLDGKIRVGLTDEELVRLAEADSPLKISRRDFATAIAKKASGGTTVAGTMFAAHKAGIRVFATGGIGGVHRESRFDVSTDMQALADTPMVVVCAGAKSILDLPATLETLETLSVPVVGYGTDEFPAFFSRSSGLPVSARLDTPQEVAAFANAHWDIGMESAVLVCQPISLEDEIPREEIDPAEEQASREAVEQGISGQRLTPFLLQRVNELTSSRSLRANLSLLLNNARLAAQIAKALSPRKTRAV
ncbi:MAG: pseudouridine-5'-phosphate glycosidase [Chloroflexota bacterium]